MVLAEWTTTHTVLVVLAAIILIVLIVRMSTKKPGPDLENQAPEGGLEGEESSEESEVE